MKPFSAPIIAVGPGSQPAEGEELACTSMPHLEPVAAPVPPEPSTPEEGAAAADLVHTVLERMRNYPAERNPPALDLSSVAPRLLELLNQSLGEGEVSIVVPALSQTEAALQIQETAFTGLWRVRRFDAVAELMQDTLEVADIPADVRQRAALGTSMDTAIGELPAGLMNAPALLGEIAHQVANFDPDAPPHVINLTLLPMQPQDLEAIDVFLGQGPVLMLSRGFGNCRIASSRLRHVWRIQYFNSMETRILDTIEITAMPAVALAADEDIAESAQRLQELVDWLRNG
ncbi:MAG: hydrogenase expression/formation C-terminal domain-containing protein [Rhodocyclaceae bacterium]